MATRRFQARFRDLEKKELLQAIGTCRNACITGSTHSLFDRKDVHAACGSIMQEIDKLAEILTGDREHFYVKQHSSGMHFESRAKIDNQ